MKQNIGFSFGGSKLVTELLGISAIDFLRVCEYQNAYSVRKKKKRSGGFRTLHIPHEELKAFQRLLLKKFLYRIYKRNYLDPNIHSFLPRKSIITNCASHAIGNWNYTARFDLKSAFPSISTELIEKSLIWVLKKEIYFYSHTLLEEEKKFPQWSRDSWKKLYPKYPIFPYKKVPWFRKLMRKSNNEFRVADLITRFVKQLLPLVTYQGQLPQGAPTSPFLLNLVISYLGIVENISLFLKEQNYGHHVTVYCDDFTISTFRPFTAEIIKEITKIIEGKNLKVNYKKTIIYNRRQMAPIITGLKLIRIKIKGKSLELFSGKPCPVKGIVVRNRHQGEWTLNRISISKKYIKETRGMINRAIYSLDNQKLVNKLEGRISFLNSIYQKLPNQVLIPYEKWVNKRKMN